MADEKISVSKTEETNDGWEFSVDVDGRHFTVTLDQEYYQHLTRGKRTPVELIHASFTFLLKQEPVTSILASFDLQQIQHYYPEFEEHIRT